MARITFVFLTIWLSLVILAWAYPRQHFEDPDSFQVAEKRSAVFLDRLMVAFQKALAAEDSHFSKPVSRQSELHYNTGVLPGRTPSSERDWNDAAKHLKRKQGEFFGAATLMP